MSTDTRALDQFGQVIDVLVSEKRAGSLRITIGGRYPLADAARAHQDLQGRRTTGKLLLPTQLT